MSKMEAKAATARRTRRNYTDEFKAGAVGLVLDQGKKIPQVARDLDLTESALRGWVERARADRGKGRPGVLTTVEKEELAKLRKEVRELRVERDILKKAAVRSTSVITPKPATHDRFKTGHFETIGGLGLTTSLGIP